MKEVSEVLLRFSLTFETWITVGKQIPSEHWATLASNHGWFRGIRWEFASESNRLCKLRSAINNCRASPEIKNQLKKEIPWLLRVDWVWGCENGRIWWQRNWNKCTDSSKTNELECSGLKLYRRLNIKKLRYFAFILWAEWDFTYGFSFRLI